MGKLERNIVMFAVLMGLSQFQPVQQLTQKVPARLSCLQNQIKTAAKWEIINAQLALSSDPQAAVEQQLIEQHAKCESESQDGARRAAAANEQLW